MSIQKEEINIGLLAQIEKGLIEIKPFNPKSLTKDLLKDIMFELYKHTDEYKKGR